MNAENARHICAYFGLGGMIAQPMRVYGGLLHRMWKIQTEKGAYAVKQLSADIDLKNDLINRNYEFTEDIASRFAMQGIPAVVALKAEGSYLHEIAETYFLVYPWVNGSILDAKVISESHALKMAEMLAKIHRINLTIPSSHEAGAPSYHPDSLLQSLAKAEIFNCSFVADLLIHKPALLAMSDAYVRSIEPLKQTLVMTHGDMDQKNVLWDGDQQPILIDWEAATWVNPSYDLINLALNWSGIITEQFNQDLFIKMIQAYQKAGGVLDQQLLSIAFDGAYGWIHWLVYNIERSCVLGESEQKNIGIEQVNQTLAALLRLRKARPSLLAALGM